MNANLESLENQLIQSSIRRMTIQDAIRLMDCSQATVYNRARKHGWNKLQEGDEIYLLIPEIDLEKHRYIKTTDILNLEKPYSNPILNPPSLEKELEKINENFSKQVEKLEQELEQKKAELENNKKAAEAKINTVIDERDRLLNEVQRKEGEIKQLNNQLSNANTSIQKYKQGEDLESSINTLKTQNELFLKRLSRPWWQRLIDP